MDIEVQFEKLPSTSYLANFRAEYLDSLPCSQEALIEVQISSATGYHALYEGRAVGYAIISGDVVLEFFLRPEYAVFGQTVFDQLLAATHARRALVKSFDALFFSSCVDRQRSFRSLGLLVRDYQPRQLPELPGLSYRTRLAELVDLPRVRAVDQDVFLDPARLQVVIEKGYMMLFEQGDALLGFGIMRVVVPGRPGVDIGIALDKPYRKLGYAPYFLQRMAELSLERGLSPLAGCAVDNHAVRATGERIGMYAKHRLLELGF
jgi:GNAT superfamily N-acetyltransferase